MIFQRVYTLADDSRTAVPLKIELIASAERMQDFDVVISIGAPNGLHQKRLFANDEISAFLTGIFYARYYLEEIQRQSGIDVYWEDPQLGIALTIPGDPAN